MTKLIPKLERVADCFGWLSLTVYIWLGISQWLTEMRFSLYLRGLCFYGFSWSARLGPHQAIYLKSCLALDFTFLKNHKILRDVWGQPTLGFRILRRASVNGTTYCPWVVFFCSCNYYIPLVFPMNTAMTYILNECVTIHTIGTHLKFNHLLDLYT